MRRYLGLKGGRVVLDVLRVCDKDSNTNLGLPPGLETTPLLLVRPSPLSMLDRHCQRCVLARDELRPSNAMSMVFGERLRMMSIEHGAWHDQIRGV